MKKVFAFIPNLLTLCNLLSGCAAVSVLFLGADFAAAFWLVIAAAVFDFFDGFAARMLHVSSPIGKELDSLADMVSFGLVPAVVAFRMLAMSGLGWLAYGGFLIVAFSALRLAKFNVDERQTEEFRGLPTPACALFFVSLPMLDADWVAGSYLLLLGLTVAFSALLVCDMPMFSLKFKSFGWKNNRLRYVFLFLSVILIVWLRMAAPAAIVLTYIVISIGRVFCCTGTERADTEQTADL
ncbi:CDP-diacylglycerol--serine O-phosphatidyltransferase [uncultured Rikenella sp.]|uniref:CDP-diacylglycerol--serine O-phosphatidyltransferase n=1 Tax=uncultured Rikenella sp. TaxID=368003 RepID=UPI0026322F16|nr:CDP-diacylglycerol--serine O-phosphatidyltransferase [uncultured Rikenella sp.]